MEIFKKIKGRVNDLRKVIAATITPKEEKVITPYEVFTTLIKTHAIVTIVLDARVDGVVVPTHLMGRESLSLQYGMNLVRPIPDLDIGNDGISATLSFGRKDFKTFVPWTAVLAIFPGNPGPVGPSGGSPNLVTLKGGKYGEGQEENKAEVYRSAA